MKAKLLNNLSLKLLSLAIAIVLWLIIVNYDNPYKTRTITGIPVEIVNEDTILSNDMIYSVVGNSTISVRVRAPRKTAEALKASDFKATADFKDLYTLTNQVPITVTCSNSRVTADEITLLQQSLEIEIEDIETRIMEVQPVITGTPSDGYQVGTVTCSPSSVRVTAPVSFLDQISYVGVPINVDGISQTMNQSVGLQFYNAGGRPMDVSEVEELSVSAENINVEVEILNVKSVNFNYHVTGQENVAYGYLYTGIELSQNSVEISGRRSDLADIVALSIPEGSLDVSDASENIVKTFDIRDLLPRGASLVDNENVTLTVTLKIEKQTTKEYTFTLSEMKLLNIPENMEIANTDSQMKVTIQGLSSDLDALADSEISLTVDLADLTAGMHSVNVTVTVPHGFTVVGSPTILVRLSAVTEAASETDALSADNAVGEAADTDASVPEEEGEVSPEVTTENRD